MQATDSTFPTHFIAEIITGDLRDGSTQQVVTRFPPEPNGFLHLGHGKSICLNFGLAQRFGGRCNLRFDDTNPVKEDLAFVSAIQDDVRWLGFEWSALLHASDYFEVMALCAEKLIRAGAAYVCDLSAEEVRLYRGTLTEPGRNSPHRDRSVEENLSLFAQMRAGAFGDGEKTLRAKINMAAGNINLRDPALYRIRKVPHQNTGDHWCIYPMYDYAHCISDAVEGITHSLCTLEFEDHRPLYDWFLDQLDLAGDLSLTAPTRAAGLNFTPSRPRQIEFARGNINYTVMSKRKLTALVKDGLVDGWDDPRMPTLSGARRRGFPAAAIRLFWERLGISKQNSVIDFSVLDGAVREVLDSSVPRRMAVLDPVGLTISNLPVNHTEALTFANHPKDAQMGERLVPFSPELYIERDDFMAEPIKGFHRLVPGGEVRLRGVGIVRCDHVETGDDGRVHRLHCTLDSTSRSGLEGSSRKVKGTIHWVCAKSAVAAEFRLYDRLFTVADPDSEGGDDGYRGVLNPVSKRVVKGFVEPAMAALLAESRLQCERLGYFVADRVDHRADQPVFNRSVTLRDSFPTK